MGGLPRCWLRHAGEGASAWRPANIRSDNGPKSSPCPPVVAGRGEGDASPTEPGHPREPATAQSLTANVRDGLMRGMSAAATGRPGIRTKRDSFDHLLSSTGGSIGVTCPNLGPGRFHNSREGSFCTR